MDTIPDKEFVALFRRNAVYINMKGVKSEQELDAMMKEMQFKMMERAIEDKRQKKKWWKKANGRMPNARGSPGDRARTRFDCGGSRAGVARPPVEGTRRSGRHAGMRPVSRKRRR